ncbi:MAG: S8 family serine peptidase [Firmicutes bacterium]|nr:S8 family serine peptidase [Bacillota bacterium]
MTGGEITTTDDPHVVAEHIEEHWERGTYSTEGSDFQLERIIVRTDGDIDDSYGAEDALHYNAEDEYILEYGTEEETAEAYDALIEEYGKENVMLDTLVQIDNISIESAAPDVSWGTHLMGFDALKCDVENDHHHHAAQSVLVAILDTGINYSHEMFRDRVICSRSKNFVNTGSAPVDDHGHGSHVAGIIADATGVHVQYLVLKVMDANGQGGLYNVIRAIDYAVNEGAKVVNLSLGADGVDPGTTIHQAAEEVLQKAHNRGVVVVAAAGNGGSSGKDIMAAKSYPAYSANTIAVGAIDSGLHHPAFSYYGSALDFVAPGQSVRSAWAGGPSSYRTASGTSMATPGISAAAAMVDIYHPGYNADEIYEVLAEHSVDLGAAGKDSLYGYGYVNLPSIGATMIGSGVRPSGSEVSGNRVGGFNVGVRTKTAKVSSVRLKRLTKGKKRFKASWTKEKNVTGYQLRYSLDSSMNGAAVKTVKKASKTKLTVKKLQRKRDYFVQVRGYKKVKGQTYYGNWSAIKRVRVK